MFERGRQKIARDGVQVDAGKRSFLGQNFRNKRFSSTSALEKLLIRECTFTKVVFPHFTFIDCHFEDCRFSNVRFRALQEKRDSNLQIGSLFLRCTFTRCHLEKCDFVMSSIRDCDFPDCQIIDSDFRNVTWMDRFISKTGKWAESRDLPDPFSRASLHKCKFGHPFSNMMGVPKEMMLPPSHLSAWGHLSEPQRSFLRLSYVMGEPPEEKFVSAL